MLPALAGCGDDAAFDEPQHGASSSSSPAPDGDGGASGGPKVTVRTAVRASDPTGVTKDATWVAFERPDGTWAPLASRAPGTYTFEPGAERWAVAIACANEDDSYTSVTVHRRTMATRVLSVALGRQCAGLVDVYALTGRLLGVPTSTGWFDFGYVDEARGVAIGATSGVAPYELVNVLAGTWDLAFGVRDSSGSPLTRMTILRAEPVLADRTLDVDLAGPRSFVPGSKGILVHGLTPEETLGATVRFTSGGAYGIDVGPPDVPITLPDVAARYATVPLAMESAGDRYRGSLVARPGSGDTSRSVSFVFHDAIDVEETLPARLPAPEVRLAAASPHARVATRLAASGGAGAGYEIRAHVRFGRRQDHTWSTTFDAASAGAGIDDTMPELGAVPGFRDRWALPADADIEVTATVTEAPHAIADGTGERASAATVFIAP